MQLAKWVVLFVALEVGVPQCGGLWCWRLGVHGCSEYFEDCTKSFDGGELIINCAIVLLSMGAVDDVGGMDNFVAHCWMQTA